MNGIVLKCCVCHFVMIEAQGIVIGNPEVRALCDACQKDKEIVVIFSEERLEMENSFNELMNYEPNNN